jgi:hypothetical protein
MQGKHLLFPLIILCGVTGGLLLVATTLITTDPLIFPFPYLAVLSSAFIYLRKQKNLVSGTMQVCLTLLSVFTVMSLVMYTYSALMGLNIFFPFAFAGSVVMLVLCLGGLLLFFMQEKKKRNSYSSGKKETSSPLL